MRKARDGRRFSNIGQPVKVSRRGGTAAAKKRRKHRHGVLLPYFPAGIGLPENRRSELFLPHGPQRL